MLAVATFPRFCMILTTNRYRSPAINLPNTSIPQSVHMILYSHNIRLLRRSPPHGSFSLKSVAFDSAGSIPTKNYAIDLDSFSLWIFANRICSSKSLSFSCCSRSCNLRVSFSLCSLFGVPSRDCHSSFNPDETPELSASSCKATLRWMLMVFLFRISLPSSWMWYHPTVCRIDLWRV